MPARYPLRETQRVKKILRELREYHLDADPDRLLEILAHEAHEQGIKPEISIPLARRLIENGLSNGI
jgi:hypothetical protein